MPTSAHAVVLLETVFFTAPLAYHRDGESWYDITGFDTDVGGEAGGSGTTAECRVQPVERTLGPQDCTLVR
eukprot:SAG11_NODE_8816_length_973_cov_1.947368_1_plen_70_part_10